MADERATVRRASGLRTTSASCWVADNEELQQRVCSCRTISQASANSPPGNEGGVRLANLKSGGETLWYEANGEGDDLLIALHGGLGLDHTCFRPWLDPLAGDLRLAYLDFRANGRSTGDGTDVTMERLAADVDALRQHLEHPRAWLLGHSYGGFVALEYALHYPSHLAGLILLDTDSTGPSQETMMVGLQRLGVHPDEMAAFGESVETTEDLLRLFQSVGAWYLPHSEPTMASKVLAQTIYRKEGSEAGQRALQAWDVTSRLQEITAPCLVMTGVDDFMFPPERAEKLSRGLPDSTFEIVHGSGHMPFVEQTSTVLDAVVHFVGPKAKPN